MTKDEQTHIANRLFKSDVIKALKTVAGRANDDEYRNDIVNDVFLALVTDAKRGFEFFNSLTDNDFKFYVVRVGINLSTSHYNRNKRIISGEAFDTTLKLREQEPETESTEREQEFTERWRYLEKIEYLYPDIVKAWKDNELEGRRTSAELNGKSEGSVKWEAAKCRELFEQHKTQTTIFDILNKTDND